MSDEEHVLCIRSGWLEHLFKAHEIESGFLPVARCPLGSIAYLAQNHSRFLPRSQCEEDTNWRQLCSYTVINSAGSLFSYERGRSGGEPRLHRRRSLGVGGHVNQCDFLGDPISEHSLEVACRRELTEEVTITGGTQQFVYVGALLCAGPQESDVDRVHCGLVYELRGNGLTVQPREDAMLRPALLDLAQTRQVADGEVNWERWSQLLLEHMGEPLVTYF